MYNNRLKVDENRDIYDTNGPAKKLFAKNEKKSILSDISNVNKGRTAPKTKTVGDIDEMDRDKPFYFSVYVKSIYSNMLDVEGNFICKTDYFDHQTAIDLDMRGVLIDWLVDVHYKFRLQPETLFLCVNYLDRFLEKYITTKENLQLIGVSCLLIASKYEEVYFPKINNFIALTDNAYSKEQILKFETIIVKTLGYSLTGPTIYQFILRYLKLSRETLEFQCVTYYFCERALLEFKLSSVIPSKVAGACIVLAFKYVHSEYKWPSILQDQFLYTLDELMPIARTLELAVMYADHTLQAIWRKYTKSILHKASYVVHEKMGDSMDYIIIARGGST